jgi:hypothetical protein
MNNPKKKKFLSLFGRCHPEQLFAAIAIDRQVITESFGNHEFV